MTLGLLVLTEGEHLSERKIILNTLYKSVIHLILTCICTLKMYSVYQYNFRAISYSSCRTQWFSACTCKYKVLQYLDNGCLSKSKGIGDPLYIGGKGYLTGLPLNKIHYV